MRPSVATILTHLAVLCPLDLLVNYLVTPICVFLHVRGGVHLVYASLPQLLPLYQYPVQHGHNINPSIISFVTLCSHS